MKKPLSLLLSLCVISTVGALIMSITLFSTPITTISGTVSNLQKELLEYVNPEKPTHDHGSAYYQRFYVSQFHLDQQSVEAKFSKPMVIAEGDRVIVSGHSKGDTFEVLAYQNLTQHIDHHENCIVLLLGALFFFAVALGLLNSQLALEGALIPKLFLFGFTLVAIYMGYRAILIRKAIKLISIQQ